MIRVYCWRNGTVYQNQWAKDDDLGKLPLLFDIISGERMGNTTHGTNEGIRLIADGEELTLILRQFENLPRPTVRPESVEWFDSDARFILANLHK